MNRFCFSFTNFFNNNKNCLHLFCRIKSNIIVSPFRLSFTFKLKSFTIKHSNIVDNKPSWNSSFFEFVNVVAILCVVPGFMPLKIFSNENKLLTNGFPNEFRQFDNDLTSFPSFADICIEFDNKCAIDESLKPIISISFSKHTSNKFIKS